jgi:hypothetical protein
MIPDNASEDMDRVKLELAYVIHAISYGKETKRNKKRPDLSSLSASGNGGEVKYLQTLKTHTKNYQKTVSRLFAVILNLQIQ